MRRALLLLIAAAALGGVAAAQTLGEDAQSLRIAKAQAAEATLRSARLEQQAAQAVNQAARARAQAEALVARIEAAEADLTAAETRIALIRNLQREQRARLAERQAPLVRLTAALQTLARRPPAMALAQPGSIDDLVRVRSVLASTLPRIRAQTAGIRAEVARTAELAAQAELAQNALATSRTALTRRRVELARFEAAQRARSTQLAGLALTEGDRALALGEEARSLARTLGTRQFQAQLQARLSALPGPLPRPIEAGPTQAPEGSPRYMLPVEGRLVTGVGEISDAGVHARGLTLDTEAGARVSAPANGRVLYAAPFRSYGTVLIIDHGRGWSTVITNLSEVDVTPGQMVSRGTAIARAGDQVTVELRRGNRPVPIAQVVSG